MIDRILMDIVNEQSKEQDIAVLLSGGIDSISVAFAAHRLGKTLHCYTMYVDGNVSSDAQNAINTANKFGWNITTINVPTDNIATDFIKLVNHYNCIKKTQLECTWPFLYVYPKIEQKELLTGWGADGWYGVSKRLIKRYDFLALPVVDREERLVGIVTVDDVIDVIEQEATRDLYAAGALQAGDEDDYFRSNLFEVARRRVLWLLVLLITNTGTSAVIASQQGVLHRVVQLAAFIPLLIGTGGNVGAQSSTVVIRGLSTDRLQALGPWRTVAREALAGLLLGLLLAAVVVPWSWKLSGTPLVAVAAGVSMIAIASLAATAGASLPLLFNRLGLDPALMSAPFITTMVDVAGVFIYLQTADWLLTRMAG